MYWIKRCYFDGVGHPESFYRHQGLTLFPEGWKIKEDNVPHTYLDLVNGGGKTTWVSLVMTLFEPQKDKFIQCVAGKKKNKKYHYNDYFHPQLSTLLLLMVDDHGRSLILGQYHQKTQGHTDVVHFLCDHPDIDKDSLFDQIPTVGRAKYNAAFKPYVRSYQDAKQWLAFKSTEGGYWRHYTTRREWLDALREVNINLEMIRSLITINSEEGGVSHFANYKSEQDFLEKFFACCFPSSEIESLAKHCSKEVEQGCELENWQRKETFCIELRNAWNYFEPLAKEAKSHYQTLEHSKLDMAEHLRDISEHKLILDQKLDELTIEVNALDELIHDNSKQLQEAIRTGNTLSYYICEHEWRSAKELLQQSQLDLQNKQHEWQIMQAMGDFQAWQQQKSRVTQLSAMVEALQKEQLQPLVDALNTARRRAKRTFDDALYKLDRRLEDILKSLEQWTTEQITNESLKDSLHSRLGAYEVKQNQLKEQVEDANERLEELREGAVIAPNEPPRNAALRLSNAVEQARTRKNVANTQVEQASNNKDSATTRNSEAQRNWQQALRQYDIAKARQESAYQAYQTISKSLSNVKIETDPDENTVIEVQLQRLEETTKQDYERYHGDYIDLSTQLHQLEQSGHLLVDDTIRRALDALYEQGLTKEQIWAFPEYLARLLGDDAEKIAAVIDEDPGRYLGIAVAGHDALKQIKEAVANIHWRDKPVPFYLITESEVEDTGLKADLVLSTDDKFLYSEKAWEDKVSELREMLAQCNNQRRRAENLWKEVQGVQTQWHHYWQQTGQHWWQIQSEMNAAKENEQSTSTAAQNAQEQSHLADEELQKCLEREQVERDNLLERTQHLDKVNDFLKNSWTKREQSEIELPKLQAKIAEETSQLQDIEQQLAELRKNERRANSQHGELIAQQQRLMDQLQRSTFNSVEASVSAVQGLSPDDAAKAVEEAEQFLARFRDNPEVKQVYVALDQAKREQAACLDQLNRHEGWLKYPKQVETLSTMDRIEFKSRFASMPTALEQAAERCKRHREEVDKATKQFEAAKRNRPPKMSISGSYKDWKTDLIDVMAQINRLEQGLDKNRNHLKFLQESRQEQKTNIAACRILITQIETQVSEPAKGIARTIFDIETARTNISTTTKLFKQHQQQYEDSRQSARKAWGEFYNLILVEDSKPPDEQRDKIMVARWKGISYETVLHTLRDRSVTIHDALSIVQSKIECIKKSWDVAVTDLEAHLRAAIRLIKEAKCVKIPDRSPVHPGKKVFQMSDDIRGYLSQNLTSVCRNCLEQWIKNKHIPSSNGQNDRLTAFLVQQLFPEGKLEIRLIKTSKTKRAQYFPINAPTGSNGQLLTSAFLLYMTVAKVREADTGIPSYGFMIADNPIGECNADELVRTQLEMAHAVGIQLIYLTGLTDINAQSMFDKNIFMGKIGQIDKGWLIGEIKSDEDKNSLWTASLQTTSLLRKLEPPLEINAEVELEK